MQCQVAYLSFSAHADAKGIADAVTAVAPGAVVLVHGESSKMSFLKAKLESSQGVPVHMPANGEEIAIERGGGGGVFGGGGDGIGRGGVGGRVVGAVAAPSVAAAVVGKLRKNKKKKQKKEESKTSPSSSSLLDPVSAAGEAVDGGWRPSPAHSALVELVLRPRRGGGFGVGLAGSENDDDDEEDEESSGDEEMGDVPWGDV